MEGTEVLARKIELDVSDCEQDQQNFIYQLNPEKNGKFLVQNINISSSNLSEDFNNYKIVQLSDLHFGPATPIEHLLTAVEIVNSLKPDLILLTGDYLQLTRTGFSHLIVSKLIKEYKNLHQKNLIAKTKELASLLNNLEAEDGIYAVFGNHDHLEGVEIISSEFPRKITWLNNDFINIEKENSYLYLAGIDDLLRGKPCLDKAFQPLKSNYEKPFFSILLSHNPDICLYPEKEKLENFDLVLSGHTHGGQIKLPLFPPPVTRTKQKIHVTGLTKFNNNHFYVTNGLGYGCLNLRFFCPPEISVITFSKH